MTMQTACPYSSTGTTWSSAALHGASVHHCTAVSATVANLHFDSIPFFQRSIQDTWCVNHLPPHVLVVHMADVQALGGERIWLYLNICARNAVDEGRFPHVGIPTHKKCSSVWVYGGQPRHVLSHLLQISQRSCLPLHQRAHSTLHKCVMAAVAIHMQRVQPINPIWRQRQTWSAVLVHRVLDIHEQAAHVSYTIERPSKVRR